MVRGAAPATVAIAELVSSGAGVLAVCADASRRAGLGNGAGGLARFNGGAALVACHRCPDGEITQLGSKGDAGLALTDYAALERLGEQAPELVAAFEHVVLVDPPRSATDEELVATSATDDKPGFLHLLWTDAEVEFAVKVLAEQWPSREAVAAGYRALRELGDCGGSDLRKALSGPGRHPLCPEAAARRFRVLAELGLVHGSAQSGAGVVRAVSSEKTDLQLSAAFRAYNERLSEAQRYLARPKPR